MGCYSQRPYFRCAIRCCAAHSLVGARVGALIVVTLQAALGWEYWLGADWSGFTAHSGVGVLSGLHCSRLRACWGCYLGLKCPPQGIG